jgi:hypothetical protein
VVGLVLCGCNRGSGREASSQSRGESTATGEPVANVDITSSLEGMAVLPRHVRWTATTSLPPDHIKQVDFKINGGRVWTDYLPPFSYGEGAYLASSAFRLTSVGKTRFVVRVKATDGSVWRKIVLARVPKPKIDPRVPAYGIWGRLASGAPRNQAYSKRSYTAELSLFPGQLWVVTPFPGEPRTGPSGGFEYELSADTRRFYVGVQVFFGSRGPGPVFSGCAPDGPAAIYAWSRTKDRFGPFRETHLVLKAKRESCAARRRVLEGLWELID